MCAQFCISLLSVADFLYAEPRVAERILASQVEICLMDIVTTSAAQLEQWLGYGQDNQGSIPSRGRDFLSSPQRLDRLWDPPSLLSNGYRG
jgi:hypothetical protein